MATNSTSGGLDLPQLRVTLTDIAYQGAAVGRANGQVVFAQYGLPEEEVLVEVEERHPRYLYGRVTSVLRPSPVRAFPPCPYFGECGGCQWQHASYDAQLSFKHHLVSEQISRVANLPELRILPVIPSPHIWHYHNHARFVADRGGKLGFRRLRGREVVPIDFCWIMLLPINRALKSLQRVDFPPGHEVVVRAGLHTGSTLVQPSLPVPDLPTGQRYLEEELLGRRFRISGEAFFQVNTLQAENLVRLVASALEPGPSDRLLDLYAGVGTFGLALADQVRQVVEVEEYGPAAEDARNNARGLDNVEVVESRAEDLAKHVSGPFEIAIVDPPRSGLGASALHALVALKPRRLAYVSCDPSTLARDLRRLADAGYEVLSLQPLDMFPQTFHIETLAALHWRRSVYRVSAMYCGD